MSPKKMIGSSVVHIGSLIQLYFAHNNDFPYKIEWVFDIGFPIFYIYRRSKDTHWDFPSSIYTRSKDRHWVSHLLNIDGLKIDLGFSAV